MSYRRPYITETIIKPGAGVVQGSGEHKIKAPGTGGSGDFIGVYAFEANTTKEAGEQIGIALTGVVKALVGASVAAGKKAVLKTDTSGAFVSVPTTAGVYSTCGTFLENGSEGEYIDILIKHGSVTIPSV
jgi:hypothetical protein